MTMEKLIQMVAKLIEALDFDATVVGCCWLLLKDVVEIDAEVKLAVMGDVDAWSLV